MSLGWATATVTLKHSFLPASIDQSSVYPEKGAAPGSLLPWVLFCLINLTKIHSMALG